MSTATTDSTSAPAGAPTVLPVVAAPPAVPPHVLDINVADLRVPRAGRVYSVDGHDLPLLVEGPDRQEVVWVTRSLRALNGEGLSRSTLRAYAKSFLRAARPMWALGCDPASISVTEYAVVRNWLREGLRTVGQQEGDARRRLAGSTLVQTEAALATIYSSGVRHGLVGCDPVAELRRRDDDRFERLGRVSFDIEPVRRRRGPRAAPPIATVEDRLIVVLEPGDRRALRHSQQPRDRALWTLCLDSGPRISEALSITPATYEPFANRARVVGKGLQGARRVIPVSDESVLAIDAYLDYLARRGCSPGPDEPIFRSLRQPYPPMTYDAAWKALRRALCRDDVHPHALRHTAATEMLDLMDGAPGQRLLRVQKILGHRSIATTDKYLHLCDDDVITAHLTARAAPLREPSAVLRNTYSSAEIALLADIRKEPAS